MAAMRPRRWLAALLPLLCMPSLPLALAGCQQILGIHDVSDDRDTGRPDGQTSQGSWGAPSGAGGGEVGDGEVFSLVSGRGWGPAAAHRDAERVRVEPFEAVELDLSVLWAT